jgi:hypothetical protein
MCACSTGFAAARFRTRSPRHLLHPRRRGPSRRGVVISSSDAVWEARPPPRERGDELLGERSPGHKVRLARERVGRVGSSPEGWVLSSPWGWVLQRDRHRPSASLDGRARPAPSIDRFAGESLRRRRPSLWAPSPKVMLPIESRLASFEDATSWIAIDSNDGVWNAFRYRPALYIADATSFGSSRAKPALPRVSAALDADVPTADRVLQNERRVAPTPSACPDLGWRQGRALPLER